MINWNEVTVGETEILSPKLEHYLIIAIRHDYVWIESYIGVLSVVEKRYLANWTIYDPWEEITENCQWEKSEAFNYSWMLEYNGEIVCNDDPNFKSYDRRVWKRKGT